MFFRIAGITLALFFVFCLCRAAETRGADLEGREEVGESPAKTTEQEAAEARKEADAMEVIDTGTASDDSGDAQWHRKTVEQGAGQGQSPERVFVTTGQALSKSEELQKAAEQGDAEAQNRLGLMYATGRGVAQDDATAVLWYQKAADQGYAPGQSNLGFMYSKGRGVAQDDARAAQWYQKAAGQGNAQAQANLGLMYAAGRGVDRRDEVKAVFWYKKAASQGHAQAKATLEKMGITPQ